MSLCKNEPMRFSRDRHGRGFRGSISTHPKLRATDVFDQLAQRALEDLVAVAPELEDATVKTQLIPEELPGDPKQILVAECLVDGERIEFTVYRAPVLWRGRGNIDDMVYVALVMTWAHMTGQQPHEIDPEAF